MDRASSLPALGDKLSPAPDVHAPVSGSSVPKLTASDKLSNPVTIQHFNSIIGSSYFQLGLFFVLAALFAYFICKLVISITAVYNQYLNMKSKVENQMVAIKIPGVNNDGDDEADYSSPLTDKYDADRMNYNDNIETQLGRLDDDVENTDSGLMKNVIKFRKEHSTGAPYVYDAYIGNAVLDAQFDDYVYPDPKQGEKSFFEYLFSG